MVTVEAARNLGAMDSIDSERQYLGLDAVRSRGVLFINYAVWAMCFASLGLGITLYLTILQRWLALLDSVRQVLGMHRPTAGIDWWLCCGLGAALIIPFVAGLIAYWYYRRTWMRRLQGVWATPRVPTHARVHGWRSGANENKERIDYLRCICATPDWSAMQIPDPGTSAESYKLASEAILKELERDLSQRSIMLGLAVGVSHNRAVDLFTIAAAAFEVQLHVLTRLGKQPSLRLWKQMLTRTISSLFISSYLNGNESLALRIAIKKMGMGLEVASDLIDHATTVSGEHLAGLFEHHQSSDWSLDDADGDDADHLIPQSVAGIPVKSIVDGLGFVTGGLVSVGTFGLRQLGVFIDRAGDELFQGALAGGILYFHGMAIAADCLAVDPAHRRSSGRTRTFGQCVGASSEVAGRVLRESVRQLRTALREKRRRALTFAKHKAKAGGSNVAGWVSEEIGDAGEQVRGAAKAAGTAVGGVMKSAADVSVTIRDHALAAGQKTAAFTSGISRDLAAKVRKISQGPKTEGSEGSTNTQLPDDGTEQSQT